MPVTRKEFADNLARAGLLTPAELAAFDEGLPPEKRPADAEAPRPGA